MEELCFIMNIFVLFKTFNHAIYYFDKILHMYIHSPDFLFVCLMLGLFFHETLAPRQPRNLRGPVPL